MPKTSSTTSTTAPTLTCTKCDQECATLGGLSGHLSRKHKLTPEQKRKYYDKHLCTQDRCLHCNKRTRYLSFGQGYAKYCGTSCQMHHRFSDPAYVKAWRKKKSADNYAAWSGKKGAQRRAEMSERSSKLMKKRHRDEPGWTEYLAAKCSKGLEKAWLERHREIVDAQNSGKSTPEFRKLRSKLTREMLNDPDNDFGHRHGQVIEYAGERFRSTWEYRFAKLLNKHGIPWEYETQQFDLPDGRRYTPDFYFPKVEAFVEVKPKVFWDECRHRLTAVRDEGYRIRYLDISRNPKEVLAWLKELHD